MKKPFFYTLGAIAIALMAAGCSGLGKTAQTTEPAQTAVPAQAADPNLPDWINELPPDDEIWGIGSADMPDASRRSMAMTMAQSRALAAIAREIDSAVQGMFTDYSRQAGSGANTAFAQLQEAVSRTLTSAQIQGATRNGGYTEVNKKLWVRYSLPKAAAKKYIAAVLEKEAAGSNFKTEEALPLVEAQLDNLPEKPVVVETPPAAAPKAAPEKPAPVDMVLIPAGTFLMGSPESEPERARADTETQHKVTITRPFYLGKHEVTQKEWFEVMGGTLRDTLESKFILIEYNNADTSTVTYKGWEGFVKYYKRMPVYADVREFAKDNYPMFYISWYDAIEYCNARSIKEGLKPAYSIDKTKKDPNNLAPETDGDEFNDTLKWTVTWDRSASGYRLPTDAEWEYACRAGTTTAYYTGDTIDANHLYMNDKHLTMLPVGKYPPNPWGLYDMAGNVFEWCWDWFGKFSTEPAVDPVGTVQSTASIYGSGLGRVIRGGRWATPLVSHKRSASRGYGSPANHSTEVGLRLARNAD